jgi:hypothetical protein
MFDSQAANGKYGINKLLSYKTILAKIHPGKYGLSKSFSKSKIYNLKSTIYNLQSKMA